MGSVIVNGEVKEARIDAVVIRADGTREDLGTVAYYNRDEENAEKNPLRRLLDRLPKG